LVSTKYKIYPMCILLTAEIGSIRGAGKPFNLWLSLNIGELM
jgi:hypothetical protein